MPDIINKEELSEVVFVAGATRAGKVILCRILSSLEQSENIRVDNLTEQLPIMYRLGELSEKACISLLKYSIHFMTYDNFIGRNSNFKLTDFTSIWNTPNPKKYFERLFSNEKSYGDSVQGDMAIKQIKESNLIFNMMIHYELMHIDIYLKAFPKCTVFHLQRHPIDLVYSWIKKGYGGEFYENPRLAIITFKYNSNIIPYYAYGWEEEYISLNETDKIIFMINHINKQSEKILKQLKSSDLNRIKHISFDKLVQNTNEQIEKICSNLNTNTTGYTNKVLIEENCPRIINIGDREEKIKVIEKTASKIGKDLLVEMVHNYKAID